MTRTVVVAGSMMACLAAVGAYGPRGVAARHQHGAATASSAHAGASAQAGGAHRHAMPASRAADVSAPVGSVLAMDVYAQRDTIDMLLAVQTAKGPALRHRRSRDGARTWTAPVTIDRGDRTLLPPKRGNDAQIAASGDTLVVTWTMTGTSRFGAGGLAAARSGDGGRTWQAARSPADAGGQGGQGFTDLAATGSGAFFAAWLDDRDGSRGLRLARSPDGGRAWEANVTLDAHTCECCWNTLAVFDAERVAVLYRDSDARSEGDARSGSDASRDSHAARSNGYTGRGGHAGSGSGAAPAGSRDMALAVSGDGGKTWASRGVVGKFAWGFEGCPHVGGGLAQSIADGAGGPAARRAWHALVWTGVEGREGVYVLRSADEGRTWSDPTPLGGPRGSAGPGTSPGTGPGTGPGPGGGGHHGAIAARGTSVTAAWDAPESGAMAIFSSTSSDGGVTWGAPRRVSTGGSATHPLLVATSTGVVAFWTERAPDGRVTWIARPLDRASS